MFKRILIANRGEIARRIARTCERLGIEYVAVYSDADRHAAHLEGAVQREWIGAASAAESYLNGEAIIAAALRTGCDAIHPGYGFLSENAGFAAAVEKTGLVFVGPAADTIAQMGDKAVAKRLLASANVPVVPGSHAATESLGLIRETCDEIGYPVILKPVAGGGGKGMRVVAQGAELEEAVAGAIRIGKANFGDGRLLVERYVPNPRHLEVQIFGDRHGNIVHLFERECSLQRRHQKIVEEAPACNLPDAVRADLFAAAVRGAQAIGYVNAGTFEFIVAPDGAFYFLEVNTRLQVEHPVTEAITGLDLVEWQLRVAAGEALPLRQEAIEATGHAIECRVYAEDPQRDFAPMPGAALYARWPRRCRVDAAFDIRGDVPSFYDPMVAKLIAHGRDRDESLRHMLAALHDTVVLGLTTNLGFAIDLLNDPRVQAGRLDTHLVDELVEHGAHSPPALLAAACAAWIETQENAAYRAGSPWAGAIGPFDRALLDPGAPLGRLAYRHDTRALQVHLTERDGDSLDVAIENHRIRVTGAQADGVWHGRVDGSIWHALETDDHLETMIAGTRVRLLLRWDIEQQTNGNGSGEVVTPMPGAVTALPIEPGSHVEQGDIIAIVEAMKMENPIHAPISGTLSGIHCRLGDIVGAGQSLASIVPEA